MLILQFVSAEHMLYSEKRKLLLTAFVGLVRLKFAVKCRKIGGHILCFCNTFANKFLFLFFSFLNQQLVWGDVFKSNLNVQTVIHGELQMKHEAVSMQNRDHIYARLSLSLSLSLSNYIVVFIVSFILLIPHIELISKYINIIQSFALIQIYVNMAIR